MPGSFIDSNVLIYIASGDPAKADRAESLIAEGGSISIQVLNEITHVARRKIFKSWGDIDLFLSSIRGLLRVHALTVDIHETGLAVAERYGISTFDAMIIASALHAGCDTLWSEDMHDGLVIEGRLRIADPFAGTGRPN